jgi:hypothetical protein
MPRVIQISQQTAPRAFAYPAQYHAAAGYLQTVGSMAVGDVDRRWVAEADMTGHNWLYDICTTEC